MGSPPLWGLLEQGVEVLCVGAGDLMCKVGSVSDSSAETYQQPRKPDVDVVLSSCSRTARNRYRRSLRPLGDIPSGSTLRTCI